FDGTGDFEPGSYGGRHLHLRLRGHALGGGVHGLAVGEGRAYGSAVLLFWAYLHPRPPLSGVMEVPGPWGFSPHSILVAAGAAGPTPQPVEQLAGLRSIPGLIVMRPADANEVAEAWKVIMQLHHEPAVLVLTRQALPTLDRSKYASAAGVAKGAYVLADAAD